MNNEIEIGMNKTGIGTSPFHSKELIEATRATPPTMPGNGEKIAEVRASYSKAADPLGSVPPPTTLKGAIGAVATAIKGESLTVFVDKLGERLAFERTGVRLYEALISKFLAEPLSADGPTLGKLEQFRAEELTHFEIVKSAIESLGGDPTVLTPAADIAAVTTMGIPQVLNDPRTNFLQCLGAILLVELADQSGWTLLVELAERLGKDEIVEPFRQALAEEEEHLRQVRRWVQKGTIALEAA